jgi:hypothetical protein
MKHEDLASEIMNEWQAKNQQRILLKAREAQVRRNHAQRAVSSEYGREQIKQGVCPSCRVRLKLLSIPETNQTHYICPGCSNVVTRNTCVDEGNTLGEKLKPGGRNKWRGKTKVRMRPDGKIEHVRTES